MPKRDNRSQAENAQGHDWSDTHDTPHATTPGQVACGQCTPRSTLGPPASGGARSVAL